MLRHTVTNVLDKITI